MNTAAARHTGLPFVPQPAPDELLGSWLLRVAQLYGLGLKTLLSRLDALQAGDTPVPHWFAIDSSTVNLNALAAAARLSQADLQAMAPLGCRPRWPQELGACVSCLADAASAGQPIAWNRHWMNPLATVCCTHGIWLTPVATRMLAGVRHAGDFGCIVQQLTAAQRSEDELACAGDALWLQDLCTARTNPHPPRGRPGPQNLIRMMDAVARQVIAATESGAGPLGLLANQRQGSVKNFAVENCTGERVWVSLPKQLRQRQRLLATVSHVLRWPPSERAFFSSWSAASIKRLASMSNLPDGALAWICPPAVELVRQEDALRREFNISPKYFKACAALLASIQ